MTKLYVAMVGLPARGKSTLAKRICSGLEQQGIRTAIFNNGELRRSRLALESASPEFFNPDNQEARRMRAELSLHNMNRAKAWLHGEGSVAIIDATNARAEQRQNLEQHLNDFPLLFVECVNEDPLLLEASIRRKTKLSEFLAMSEAEALASFRQRLAYYEQAYVPVKEERCWMRVDSADSRILAEAPSNSLPYYAAIRDIVVTHWVQHLYLVRHGETVFNLEGRIGGDPDLTPQGTAQAGRLAEHFRRIPLPYIFTSTRLRSVHTAAPLLKDRPDTLHMPLAEFDEIDAGVCEGLRYEDIRNGMPLEYAARAANKFGYVYPRGESYAMLKDRVARGLRRALFIAGEGTLMIVGHQAINRTILALFLFHRPQDVPFTYIPQNQYYHITITQRKKLFEMVRYA